MERPMDPMPDDLTPDELVAEAEAAEALPERAAMSTLNVTSLDPAAGAAEAVGDGVPDASVTDTGAHVPPPHAVAAGHDGTHRHGAHQAAPAQTTTTPAGPAEQGATPSTDPAPSAAPAGAEAS